jgi:hypothetical protein
MGAQAAKLGAAMAIAGCWIYITRQSASKTRGKQKREKRE